MRNFTGLCARTKRWIYCWGVTNNNEWISNDRPINHFLLFLQHSLTVSAKFKDLCLACSSLFNRFCKLKISCCWTVHLFRADSISTIFCFLTSIRYWVRRNFSSIESSSDCLRLSSSNFCCLSILAIEISPSSSSTLSYICLQILRFASMARSNYPITFWGLSPRHYWYYSLIFLISSLYLIISACSWLFISVY